jgi:secreted trypsin-like serine protease
MTMQMWLTEMAQGLRIVALFALAGLTCTGAALADGARAIDSRGPERIINGEVVTEAHGPWAAAILKDGGFYCGGSLVAPIVVGSTVKKWERGQANPRWVVTAAHCLYDNVDPRGPLTADRLTVRTGTLNRENDKWELKVIGIIEHPDYNRITLENDIALLLLEEPSIPLEATQRASIGLPDDAELSWINAPYLQLYAMGWGATEISVSGSSRLMQVRVPRVAYDHCRANYRAVGSDLADGMICAGYAGGEFDSCQGDSGGPLVYRPHYGGFDVHPMELLQKARLVGVVSWGIGCARRGFPGIYSSITYFQSWMEQAVVLCEKNHKRDCTRRARGSTPRTEFTAFDATRSFVPMISGQVRLYPAGCKQNRNCRLAEPIRFQQTRDVAWESDAWPGPSGPQSGTTDGASIPGWAQPFVGGPWDESYLKAAILHDHYCYKENNVRSWQDTHRMFYDAMIASGVPAAKANIMYFAVRTFGPRWAYPNKIPFEYCGKGCIKQARTVTAAVADHQWIGPRYDHLDVGKTLKEIEAAVNSNPNLTIEELGRMADDRRTALQIETISQ